MPLEEAVLDAPAEEIEVQDAPEETTEATDEGADESLGDEAQDESEVADEAEEELAEGTEPVAADGRKMPDGLKKGIAALKSTMPEVAKEVKRLYWANQEYAQIFPKPADALAVKNLVDEVGGPEGIQGIHAEREEWNGIDAAFAEGKPEFYKGLAESNPDAFVKGMPHAINAFAEKAPQQYEYYANNIVVNKLAGAGLSLDNLKAAYKAYGEGENANPTAQAIIAEVYNAVNGMKAKATEFEQKRTDPREAELKQKESAFEEKRRGDFEGRVADEAERAMPALLKPELDRLIGTRKIGDASRAKYEEMAKAEMMRLLGEVPGFANQLEAHHRTGDSKKSVEYITGKYRSLAAKAASVIDPFLRDIKPSGVVPVKDKLVAGQQRTAAPGEITLKEMPDRSQIDFTRCTVAEVMMGKAVLKNGKVATGWA